MLIISMKHQYELSAKTAYAKALFF